MDGTAIEALALLKSYRAKDEQEPLTMERTGDVPQMTSVRGSSAGKHANP